MISVSAECYIQKSRKIFCGQGEVREKLRKMKVEKNWPPCLTRLGRAAIFRVLDSRDIQDV